MSQEPLNPEAAMWAAHVAAGYADRARPEMSEGARDILLDHLTRHLTAAIAGTPVGDWPEAANAALDAWEDEARTDGPRVSSFDETAVTVRFGVSS